MMFRRLLAALSALSVLLPLASADARPRGAATLSSAFNGGINQANLAGLQTSGSFAFMNCLKEAQAWGRGGGNNSPVTPDMLNSDGYPVATIPGDITTTCFRPDQRDRPGNYVMDWSGNGTTTLGMSNTVLPTATFTGSVTAGVLTAGAPSGGTIQKGMLLSGTGVSSGTIIGAQLTGSAGMAGTYSVVGTTTAGSTSMTVDGGSKTSSGGSGRYVFSTVDTRFVVGISTVGSPIITNMRVYHVDDEAALNAGEVFSSFFKNKLRSAGIGVIRSLGWGGYADGYNRNNTATWAMRKPQSYVFYDDYELRSGKYAGSTSLSGQAYTVGNTPDGFTLTDKAYFHALTAQSYPATQISFSNGSANIGWTSHGLSVNSRVVLSKNSADAAGTPATNFSFNVLYFVVSVPDPNTVTLSATQGGSAIVAGSAGSGIVMGNPQFTINANGTGAKWVLNENSSYITDNSNTRPVANTFQSLATYIYDAGLDVYLKFGGDAAYNSMGINNGVPPELQMRLAVEIGAHLWLPMPFLTQDPVTDYVPEVISMVKNYPGASWMKPRFEPVNELWNGAAPFYGTYYANVKAPLNWPGVGANYMDWYGKVLSTLGQTAANIYGGVGGLGTSYNVMLGIQTATGVGGGTSGSDERANSSKYVAQAAAGQSLTWSGGTINYTKTAAKGWTSHVTPANYITPSEYGSGTETTRATNFAGVRFVASITAGAMTVSQIDTSGGTLAIGKTIFGRGIAGGALQSGITITGGSAPNWTLSSAITLASDTFYAGTDMTQPGLYVDSLGGASAPYNLAYVNSAIVAWKSWATTMGINKMEFYEGGYSPDYSCGGVCATDILRFAGKLVASSPGSATGLQGYTYGNTPSAYSNIVAAGGAYPSLFLPTGEYPSSNAWSVLENVYQPNPPLWKAICAYNGTPC